MKFQIDFGTNSMRDLDNYNPDRYSKPVGIVYSNYG